ncbi:uncharacterized protein OCT59_002551 [Rhizophagus irregularis]|uniref:uncharacterized protein n=1 Tax=Rhizophagus irregularis TaxID=588596 RepID=UPI0033255F84|nr:hypothetical protein OCT59_002551 [Rhizophagus irregularis]
MSEKIDLSDIEELDINYIELDPEYQVESDSNTIESWKNPRDCLKNIQYSLGGGGQSSIKNCPFFGNISVNKEERNCMGIKHCEFINPEIINISHNEVDFDSEFWQKISKNKHVETKKIKDLYSHAILATVRG